jgi:hypothetical protein
MYLYYTFLFRKGLTHASQSEKSPGMKRHFLMQDISFFVSVLDFFLVTRPDLFSNFTSFLPLLFFIVTEFILVLLFPFI